MGGDQQKKIRLSDLVQFGTWHFLCPLWASVYALSRFSPHNHAKVCKSTGKVHADGK
jgi:hypothetical protein